MSKPTTQAAPAPPEKKTRAARNPARDAEMIAMLKGDKTLQQIADHYGISKPMVHKIGHKRCPEVMAQRGGKKSSGASA